MNNTGHNHNISLNSGFTLIELSIILVIIGLIVGGILVGRDLIKSAEIRSQLSQLEEYATAINTFKVKYNSLPGDMPPSEASPLGFFTFTGAAAGLGCVAQNHAYGNNDGAINIVNEPYAFWSHLSSANIIKGNFAGTNGSLLNANASSCAVNAGLPSPYPSTDSDWEKVLPHAKISSGPIFIKPSANRYWAPGNSIRYSGTQKANFLTIMPTSGSYTMSPYQAYQLDSKVDDGMPGSGIVRDYGTHDNGAGTMASDAPCTTSASLPYQYDLSSGNADNLACGNMDFFYF